MNGIGIYIDIVDSRKIKQRTEVEFRVKNLQKYFKDNNELGIFEIWKGLDEYMILSPSWETANEAVIKIQEILHPYAQRFVITPFENVDYSKKIHTMDNPKFVILSDGMIKLKKTSLFVEIIASENEILSEAIAIILNAIILIKNAFTSKQMEVYRLYKIKLSQKEIASRLNKSQQYVSDTLNRINFDNVNAFEVKLNHVVINGFQT